MTLVLIGLVGGGSAGPDTGPDAESARRRPYLVVLGLRTVGLTLGFAVGAAIPLLAFALAGRGLTQRLGPSALANGFRRTRWITKPWWLTWTASASLRQPSVTRRACARCTGRTS